MLLLLCTRQFHWNWFYSDICKVELEINILLFWQNTAQAQHLHFVEGSYGDKQVLDKVFKKYNIIAVIHFGGFKAVGESKQLPLMYYRNNVAGVLFDV